MKRHEDASNRDRVTAKRREFINWLKVCDPSTNHNKARNLHEPGTGTWFINSQDFIKWRDKKTCSLWLQGNPRAGKTILCSTIIEEVQKFCALRSGYRCIYFYFDFSDEQKQDVDNFLRSVIVQLFENLQDIPNEVQSLYDECNGNQPSHDALIKTLVSLLKSSNYTYILIDALDECCERSDMAKLLSQLILPSDSINVLITSRKEQDIISELQSHIEVVKCMENAKIDTDVEIYIQKRLDTDRTLRRCLPMREEVTQVLVEGANGMYIYVCVFIIDL